jgi:hypothetical protein
MSSGGRINRLLDSIPGYAGYRDKERRRDSDRLIREKLARDYGQLADRLGRMATTLAQERNIAAIGIIDRPHKRLVSFIDRLTTASYGYAPLFSDQQIDGAALDQIAAFDEALADQQDILARQIGELEVADPKSPDYKRIASEITATIEGLHQRFQKRGEVVESGRAAPQQDVLALLGEKVPVGSPVAFRLHEGEAVSFAGENYTVIGRVAVATNEGESRAFQLRGGSNDVWLMASSRLDGPVYWLRRVESSGTAGDEQMSANGQTYNLDSLETGKGEVIGPQGSAADQAVRHATYRSASGDVLHAFDWQSGTLTLAGSQVDPRDLQLFTREI